MGTTGITPVTSASFDASATFQPAISQDTVLISGSAANALNIADLELYDNGNDIGGVTGFQSSNSGWSFTTTLKPGRHFLTATVTELSGASYTVTSPYQLVTGVTNQPYVYQELDENGSGVVTRVSNYDGAGTLVSQTAVAVNGGAAAPMTVAFDPTATFEAATETLLTGTTAAYGAAQSIEIFDGAVGSVIDPQTGGVKAGARALGYATLGNDGTWSFDAHVAAGLHRFTAVATGTTGLPAAAQSSFTIQTGIVGSPYVYQETDHTASGGVAAITSYAQDGTVVSRSNNGGLTVNGGFAAGEVLHSSSNDVMTSDGTGSTAFVFTHGFGRDEIANFNYLSAAQNPGGIEHDILSLPQSVFHTFAQVLHRTTSALDGDAVIHLSPSDSVKLDGVTKAELMTHPDVVRFHA